MRFSPIVLAIPGAQVLRFGEDGIEEITYEETEAYQTMSLFISDRERLLERLLQP
jgi:predicted ATPase